MNEIQKVFGTKENLEIAVDILLDELGTAFNMQSDSIKEKILLSIGKYHLKMKENESE